MKKQLIEFHDLSDCFSSEEDEETPSWEPLIDKEQLLVAYYSSRIRFSSCVDEGIVVGFDHEVLTFVDQLTGFTKQQLSFSQSWGCLDLVSQLWFEKFIIIRWLFIISIFMVGFASLKFTRRGIF